MNRNTTQRISRNSAPRQLPSAHVPFPASADSAFADRYCSSSVGMLSSNADSNPLIDRRGAASYLGVKPQTLANWAVNRAQSLPYIKIGRRVMYRLADLEAFVMANRHGSEAVIGGAHA